MSDSEMPRRDQTSVPSIDGRAHVAGMADAPRPWGFWMTIVWLGIAFLVLLMMGFGYLALRPLLPAAVSQSGVTVGIVVALISFFALSILAFAASLTQIPPTAYFALSTPRADDVLLGLAVLTAWILAFEVVTSVFGLTLDDEKTILAELRHARGESALAVSTFVLYVVAVAPIAEEAAFRGFMYLGWSQSPLGVRGTIALTALVFGLAHWNYTWAGITDTIGAGIIFGWMRWRTGTILAPIVLHIANNVLSLVYLWAKYG